MSKAKAKSKPSRGKGKGTSNKKSKGKFTKSGKVKRVSKSTGNASQPNPFPLDDSDQVADSIERVPSTSARSKWYGHEDPQTDIAQGASRGLQQVTPAAIKAMPRAQLPPALTVISYLCELLL
jgi:hypothetical protein